MIAVFLFSAAIIATAIGFLLWANNLDKREKELKQKEADFQTKESELNSRKAHLDAVSERHDKEKKALIAGWEDYHAKAAELAKREQEFDIHKASVKADGTLGEKVAAAVEERIKKPKKAKK